MEKVILAVILVICMIYDHRNHRIPNLLCGIGALFGCVLQYHMSGLDGMIEGICYAGVIFAILLPLWILKVLGGGDVKLMMVCCLYVREKIFVLLLFVACCTAFFSLILMIVRRNFIDRMKLFAQYIYTCMIDGMVSSYPFDRTKKQDCKSGGMLVSYGIAAGYFLWLFAGR